MENLDILLLSLAGGFVLFGAVLIYVALRNVNKETNVGTKLGSMNTVGNQQSTVINRNYYSGNVCGSGTDGFVEGLIIGEMLSQQSNNTTIYVDNSSSSSSCSDYSSSSSDYSSSSDSSWSSCDFSSSDSGSSSFGD